MSFEEAGKKGAEATHKIIQEKKKNKIQTYLNNPTICKCCSSHLPYEKRHNKFCSSSCSAKISNTGKIKNKYGLNGHKVEKVLKINKVKKSKNILIPKKCLNCSKSCNNKFCSVQCQGQYTWKKTKKTIETNQGFSPNEHAKKIRRYMLDVYEHRCSICERTEWGNTKIPLVVDHIDGNPTNNNLNNLRLICCNCDALTDTYKGKNRGNGRFNRKQRYHDGKSF